jgi:hypothetical protein
LQEQARLLGVQRHLEAARRSEGVLAVGIQGNDFGAGRPSPSQKDSSGMDRSDFACASSRSAHVLKDVVFGGSAGSRLAQREVERLQSSSSVRQETVSTTRW